MQVINALLKSWEPFLKSSQQLDAEPMSVEYPGELTYAVYNKYVIPRLLSDTERHLIYNPKLVLFNDVVVVPGEEVTRVDIVVRLDDLSKQITASESAMMVYSWIDFMDNVSREPGKEGMKYRYTLPRNLTTYELRVLSEAPDITEYSVTYSPGPELEEPGKGKTTRVTFLYSRGNVSRSTFAGYLDSFFNK